MILDSSSYKPSGTPAAPTPVGIPTQQWFQNGGGTLPQGQVGTGDYYTSGTKTPNSDTPGLGFYNGPVMDSFPPPTPNLGAGTTTGGVFTPSTSTAPAATAATGLNNSFGQGANGYSAAGSGSGGFSGGSGGPFPLEGQYGIVKMNHGGLASAAQHLSNKGRGNDSMLVHMSPREVGGLQQLAKAQGGSLSINPNTGLVEAGFLEQALPIVAAAAATYFTAGAAAPALSAALGSSMAGGILAGAGAGALIGGGTAAIQGNRDVGQAALMGGIGGAIAGGTGAYADTGTSNLFSSATAPTTDAATTAAATTPTITNTPTAAELAQLRAPVTNTAYTQALNASPAAGTATTQMATPQQVADITGFTQGMTPPPPTPGSDFYATSSPITKAGILALPGLGAQWGYDKTNQPGQEQYDPNSPYRWRLASNFTGSTPVQPNPYYKANYSGYAAGGLASLQGNMYPQSQQDTTQFAVPSQMPTSAEVVRSDYDPKTDPYSGQPMMMSGGGLSDLGGYSDGGRMLKGRGDGMSDSIPANIGGKQPARLADGEFVVPADVVSHLGNGSTDAGAKRLYSMMDKVRQARTGKKKQAPAVNPNKLMPV